MGRTRTLYLAAAAILAAASAIVCLPRWIAGRRLDAAGAAYLYGHRRPAPASNRIVLVEIDDASVDELGPWPWEASVIYKVFEAPFASAGLVVPLVSPEDFAFEKESADAFWGALSGLKTASAFFPFPPVQPDIDVAAVLGNHPAGDQGQLVRAAEIKYETINVRLPAWRRQVITSLASNYLKRNPQAGASDFLARVLDPYWRNSVELERVAEFAYSQARLAGDLANAGREPSAGLDADSVAEVEDVYVQPILAQAAAVGFSGAGGIDQPYQAAVAAYGGRWFVRIPFAAAGALSAEGTPETSERSITVKQPDGRTWSAQFGDGTSFLPDWAGNEEVEWNKGFWRFSAAALVEAVNARRALWEGYIRYEASKGRSTLAPLVAEYDKAAAPRDEEAMSSLYRQIRNRTNELKDTLGFSESSEGGASSEGASSTGREVSEAVADVMSLEYDQQALGAQLNEAFDGKVVVIIPTAQQFPRIATPWGENVPAGAVEVAILSSIFEGRSIRPVPALLWWAIAAGGALVAAGLAARLGAARAFIPCAVLALAAFSGWFFIFALRGVYLGASCLAPLVVCYTGGSVIYAIGEGRTKRRLRRLLSGHVSKSGVAASVKRSGADVLRAVREAGAMTAVFASDAELGDAAVRRLSVTVAEAALSVNGIMLDSAGDVEVAFGWLAGGDALDAALSAALSARNRVKPVMEKLAAEGDAAVMLRMGLAAGPGRIAAGIVSRDTLRPKGAVFDKSRRAAAAARKWRATIVMCAADAAGLANVAETRRLDPAGEFVEILDRKGALAVTAERVRGLYEAALADLAAGRLDSATKRLDEAIALNGDGPSKALIGYIDRLRAAASQ